MLGSASRRGKTRDDAPSIPSASSEGPLQLNPTRILFAALSGAAGVIHLVMVPSHMGESTLEGVGFAIAGWSQLTIAVLAVVGLSRSLLFAAVVLNAILIGAWTISRTVGLPWAEQPWTPEPISFVDATCVGFEAALIALSGLLLLRPSIGQGGSRVWQIAATSLPLVVLVLTTAALASPDARDHAAGGHGHGGDDSGLSLLTDDHHGVTASQPLDSSTQDELDEQLNIAHDVIERFPTVAAAEAAGYRRAGPFEPGTGAHYVTNREAARNPDGVMNRKDLLNPFALIYDGTSPTSRIAGLMYYSTSPMVPKGFAGPNDAWHYHERTCVKDAADGESDSPFGSGHQATPAECDAVGGEILRATHWMVHLWIVPEYSDPASGIFVEINPELTCPDGSYHLLPLEERPAYPLNICASAA
jgi:hypothetical protein